MVGQTIYSYDGRPNLRHRILVRYQDRLVPLLWFKIGKDGSFYAAPMRPQTSAANLGANISHCSVAPFCLSNLIIAADSA